MEASDNLNNLESMKLTKYLLFVFILLAQLSCVKDPLDDVNSGGWNHERKVLNIKFENQVGVATIETTSASTGDITLSINVAAIPDLSQVKLADIEMSYQANASISVGDALNFENESRTASFLVTSATGETREYKIHVNEFTESLVGVWEVKDLTVYGGTGPEYGGGAVLQLASKSWCWSETVGPDKECDNTLTFTMTDITDDGNTSGICINDAGADGKYADFIFAGSMNKENPGVPLDLKKFYRQIPEGKSTWVRNYSAGTITFTDANGKVTTGSLVGAGKEDLGNGLSMTVQNNAFAFNLNGTDDWSAIYSDYDKFAKKARRYWISVVKR